MKQYYSYLTVLSNVFTMYILGNVVLLCTILFASWIGITVIYLIVYNTVVIITLVITRKTIFLKYEFDGDYIRVYLFAEEIRNINWSDIEAIHNVRLYNAPYIRLFSKSNGDSNEYVDIFASKSRLEMLKKNCSNTEVLQKLNKIQIKKHNLTHYGPVM